MRKNCFLLVLSLFISSSIFAQGIGGMKGTMTILDTVIEKKHCQTAVKLNVRLSLDMEEPLVLPRFYEYVNSDGLYSVIEKGGLNDYLGNYGLSYVVVDGNGDYVNTGYSPVSFASFEKLEDEDRFHNSRWVVDKRRLNARYKWIKDDIERARIDKAELLVHSRDTTVTVYPIILLDKDSSNTRGEGLKPGKYRLFLFYSFQKDDIRHRNIFSGYMKSNEVTLIIK